MVLSFGGHKVGTVERYDLLASSHVVPQRDPSFFDPPLDPRHNGGYSTIVKANLPAGFENSRQLDDPNLGHHNPGHGAGVEQHHLRFAALANELRYGGRGRWSSAACVIALTSAGGSRSKQPGCDGAFV